MRESKYRAWIKNADKMVDVIAIDLEKEEICWIFDDYVNWEQERVWIGFDDIALMQYTGLKDKSGIEIYEGDIVSNREFARYLSGQERCSNDVGIVRYDTKSGCLVINNDNGRTKRLTVKVIKNNRVKVLGNIYENPELMV